MTEVDGAGAARIDGARAELDRLDHRLRSLSAGAWRSRRTTIDQLLAHLVDLTAEVEGRSVPALPELPEFALPDVLSVLAGDVLAAEPTSLVVDRLTEEVRAVLNATR